MKGLSVVIKLLLLTKAVSNLEVHNLAYLLREICNLLSAMSFYILNAKAFEFRFADDGGVRFLRNIVIIIIILVLPSH